MQTARLICAALTALVTLKACGTPEQLSGASQPTAAPPALAATAAPISAPTSTLPPATAAPSDVPTRGPVPEPPPNCGAALAIKPGQPQPTPAQCQPTATGLPAAGSGSSGAATGSIVVAGATTGPLAAQPTTAEERDPSGTRLAEPGPNLDLHVGETFRLKLSDGMDWAITIADTQVIARAPGAAPADPAGPYQALAPGTTFITVVGNPTCLKSHPACLRPSIAYQIQVTAH